MSASPPTGPDRDDPQPGSTGHDGPEPGGPERDEAFDRLRAADPARDLEPDLTRLRADVATRIAAADGAPHPADQLAARRARRAPLIAAVAASALVVGGLGFGLGRLGGSGLPPADGVIVLSVGEASSPAAEGGAGDAASTSADSRLSFWPTMPWRTVFTASGLTDTTGRAEAWAFDPAAVFSAESATAAAAALGLQGEASEQFGAWLVGVQDGTGASLTLQPDGYASLSFYDPARDPNFCLSPRDAARAGPGSPPRCASDDPTPAPSGTEAAAAMRDLLAALGIEASVEIETSELDVPEAGQPRMTSVSAYQVLGGQRTGTSWTAMFAGGGVQSFFGPLAPVVSLGEYDVVSANEAVRRLGDPRFGASGGVMPLSGTAAVAREGAAVSGLAPDAPVSDTPTSDVPTPDVPTPDLGEGERAVMPEPIAPTVPTAPEAGDPIAWPVTEVTITGARLGLALQWLPDGAAVLLPAFELTDDDGAAWSVLAVADAGLDFSTE